MPIRRFSKTLFSDVTEYRTFKVKSVLISSSGGSISNSGGYTIHTISSTGATNFSITGFSSIDYLIVAGGGSGNQGYINTGGIGGGGGGAGGYLTGTVNINSGLYSIVVGSGGVFVANLQGSAANGVDSSAFGIVSTGGGGGGMQSRAGASGGSGGGGGGNNSTPGGSGVAGQGNAGGTGAAVAGSAGGGGGAGTAGQNPTAGSGLSNSISGSSVTYSTGGTGGLGGSSGAGSAGAANTGNGGQGGQQTSAGGNGGSGIVILRYITNQYV